MALITLDGDPACRTDVIARAAAQRLGWELVTDARMARLLESEFGGAERIPAKAWGTVVLSVLAKLATAHHVVVSASGCETVTPRQVPALLRVRVTAPESWRIGSVMVDRRLDRNAARAELAQLDAADRAARRERTGRTSPRSEDFDLMLNAASMEADICGQVIESAALALQLPEHGLLSRAAEAQLQFRVRLELSRHGMSPPDKVDLQPAPFVHPSEELFARLLDFYRIEWQYEPKSFPIQWDADGRVTEAFTPDFYLPEFDLYLELTTMKQANVTRKNRKVRLVKELYPHVNIQVFYQRDFENLIFKYGAPEVAEV